MTDKKVEDPKIKAQENWINKKKKEIDGVEKEIKHLKYKLEEYTNMSKSIEELYISCIQKYGGDIEGKDNQQTQWISCEAQYFPCTMTNVLTKNESITNIKVL